MNNMSEKLVKSLYEKNGKSLRKFTRDVLRANKGSAVVSLPMVSTLIASVSDARIDICKFYIENTLEEMRAHQQRVRVTKHRKTSAAPTIKTSEEGWRRRDESRARVANGVRGASDEILQAIISGGYPNPKLDAFLNEFAGSDLETWHNKSDAYNFIIREVANRALRKQLIKENAKLEATSEKARSFDRIILALDTMQVGNKLLGDCTGADLLREATRLETLADGVTVQAVFYRQLSSLVGKTTTVRQANDRGKIVALLTHQFKSE